MNIIGISAFYHDSAVTLVKDGEVVFAAQEERFSRVKHDRNFPKLSLEWILQEAELNPAQLDAVAYYDKPLLTFDRLLETWFSYAPTGFSSFWQAFPTWLNEKLFLPGQILKGVGKEFNGPLYFLKHHESHAASAFYPSPFEEAAVLTMDGVGEWSTTTLGVGQGKDLRLLKEIRFPHSLGLLYSAFTTYLGFKVNSAEYKVMGLAPYGKPRYAKLIIEHLIDLKPDGSFWMDMSYFNYCQGLTMTSSKFHDLFGGPPRDSDAELTPRHMDLAASIQRVCEEVMLALAREAKKMTGMKHLCLAGGCALNCVANGLIHREKVFDEIFIQPAAGDAGGSLGAALYTWYGIEGNKRAVKKSDSQKGSFLGPKFADAEIKKILDQIGASYKYYADSELPGVVADLIGAQRVVGFFHGRMEFGPRALGARSLLGDPRNPEMQTMMNVKIKFRESFRPFAPAVLQEKCAEYFDLDKESPYMLLVAPVRERHRKNLSASETETKTGVELLNTLRSDIPAVTHVDFSARVQTVSKERNGVFYDVLKAFHEKTGCPVVVNTSFNIRGEPIVNRPEEAYRCFMFTDMDALVLGNCVLLKENQPPMAGAREYKEKFKKQD